MTKRERIEELEREVAELKARPPIEYHYHYDRPTYYGARCGWCGAGLGLGHTCWYTSPYWSTIGGESWGATSGGVLTTSGSTSGYAALDEAAAIVYNSGVLE
jgi:hypothetical protein